MPCDLKPLGVDDTLTLPKRIVPWIRIAAFVGFCGTSLLVDTALRVKVLMPVLKLSIYDITLSRFHGYRSLKEPVRCSCCNKCICGFQVTTLSPLRLTRYCTMRTYFTEIYRNRSKVAIVPSQKQPWKVQRSLLTYILFATNDRTSVTNLWASRYAGRILEAIFDWTTIWKILDMCFQISFWNPMCW